MDRETPQVKRCWKCGTEKAVSDFYKNKTKHDGLTSECKECVKKAVKENRAANPERCKEFYKKHYAENKEKYIQRSADKRLKDPESVSVANRRYYEKNKERKKADSKRWSEENRERCLETKRRYTAENKALLLEKNREWKRNNYWKVSEANARRKAQKRKATPQWADRKAILEIYRAAQDKGMHVDHIVPICSACVCGLHVPANLQILEPSTNISKGNRYWPDMP